MLVDEPVTGGRSSDPLVEFDQHHASQARPVKGARQQGEDGPVRGRERRPVDLSLQNAHLMAKGQDLGGRLSPDTPEPSDQEPEKM